MKQGKKMYDSGRFYKAGTNYEKAFKKTPPKAVTPFSQAEIAMKIGESYEGVNRLKDAYSWYRRASKSDKQLKESYLKMSKVSADRGIFEAAEAALNQFIELFPDDERGKDALDALEVLKKKMKEQGRYVVEPVKELNSRNNEFSPVYDPFDNSFVYFTSTRRPNIKNYQAQDPVTGELYSNIFKAEFTNEDRRRDKNGNVKVLKVFPEPRWMKPDLASDSLRSSKHDGAVSITADGEILYFTSSRPVNKQNVGTRIYKATKGKAQEGEPATWSIIVPSGIIGDTVSIGHPAITPDGSKMYFVTDQLPDGKGGKDIWFVESSGSGWGDPVNAGDVINTEKNEMFPYVRDNGDLYFSSDGHGGLGGLDIFKFSKDDGQLQALPAPINSFADDFGITFQSGKEEGLFSSSRLKETDHIFSFKYIYQQLFLRALVRNAVTEDSLPGTNVVIVSDDGVTTNLVTDSLGFISLKLTTDNDYVITTERVDYLKGKAEISTYTEKGDKLYDIIIDMQAIDKPIVIPNIYFDVAKWDIREDAAKNLEQLLTILKENPNITIEIAAHTDMVGNDNDNLILSENRAASVVEYLITKGIHRERLSSKGYGETQPREVTEKIAELYPFLKPNDVLDERFIGRLRGKEKEDALQLNRRIEFKVLRTNYKPGAKP
ncbi:cell envelope biogenesis protein OmpA [Bacteroidia bacterium]|nr:cell envelope biogenesis protein OmpA [Bacteroidia bacterium]